MQQSLPDASMMTKYSSNYTPDKMFYSGLTYSCLTYNYIMLVFTVLFLCSSHPWHCQAQFLEEVGPFLYVHRGVMCAYACGHTCVCVCLCVCVYEHVYVV